MRCRLALLAAGCVAFPGREGAAQGTLAAFSYSVSIPSGHTREFTNHTSLIGLSIAGRRFLGSALSVGLDLGWNELYWKTSQPLRVGNATVSGQQYRDLNIFPLFLSTHFYLGHARGFRPYLGVNAGGYYIVQRFTVGLSEIEADHWHLGLAPEAGILIPLGEGWNAILTGKYHYPLEAGNYLGGSRSFRYISIGVGLAARR